MQRVSAFQKILGPYYEIFSTKDNTFNMIICGFLFFSVFFLFYGLLFNLDKIEGDLYLHNLIMYVSEMIAELNTGYILSRYKRIPTFIAINSLSFICCLVLIYFDRCCQICLSVCLITKQELIKYLYIWIKLMRTSYLQVCVGQLFIGSFKVFLVYYTEFKALETDTA